MPINQRPSRSGRGRRRLHRMGPGIALATHTVHIARTNGYTLLTANTPCETAQRVPSCGLASSTREPRQRSRACAPIPALEGQLINTSAGRLCARSERPVPEKRRLSRARIDGRSFKRTDELSPRLDTSQKRRGKLRRGLRDMHAGGARLRPNRDLGTCSAGRQAAGSERLRAEVARRARGDLQDAPELHAVDVL